MQQTEYIMCFCEECLRDFRSYIAKDICPVCEKLLSNNKTKSLYTTEDVQRIQKQRKLRDD